MCIHDYIYENYDNYKKLYEEFSAVEFYNAISTKLVNYPLTWLVGDATITTNLKTFISLLAYPIWYEYQNDKIAYADKDVLIMRIVNSLTRKVNKWYLQKKIGEDLLSNATLEKFISNGGTHSETKENASTGSAVIQKSASTPTGITHDSTEEDVDLTLEHADSTHMTTLGVDDNYDDKYTNFVGKTNGLHRNEVDRDTDITRSSSYALAQEILDKIPYSYINEVLAEVSQHFIQIY